MAIINNADAKFSLKEFSGDGWRLDWDVGLCLNSERFLCQKLNSKCFDRLCFNFFRNSHRRFAKRPQLASQGITIASFT